MGFFKNFVIVRGKRTYSERTAFNSESLLDGIENTDYFTALFLEEIINLK